jgi:hypothetical protein
VSHAYDTVLPSDTVEVWRQVFIRQRSFAEHAFAQLDDDAFFRVLAPGLNSVAVIANHIAGNLRSRFTDFLTTDGEKPDRDRDAEFIPPQPSAAARAEITARWDAGWSTLFATLDALTPADLHRTVLIRAVPHPVHAAVLRQIDHYAFHVGQINILARMIVGTDRWKWFTLPPGGTKAFNQRLMGGSGP